MLSKILLGSVLSTAAASPLIKIDPTSRVLRDAQDRHTIFHGVNVVYKVKPYIPEEQKFDSQNSLTEDDIANLKKWGMNFVRLGVMWEAVETAPGVYNEGYLREIDKLITQLGEAGIYTLVDAHQDVMGRIICGEGMPNFYAKQIIDAGTYCVDHVSDLFLSPVWKLTGLCKSLKSYGWRTDSDGNPLIEDC